MKFSIRDLLLVTVIVALALGWWLDRSSLAAQIQTWERRATFAQSALIHFGCQVEWIGESISMSQIKLAP